MSRPFQIEYYPMLGEKGYNKPFLKKVQKMVMRQKIKHFRSLLGFECRLLAI